MAKPLVTEGTSIIPRRRLSAQTLARNAVSVSVEPPQAAHRQMISSLFAIDHLAAHSFGAAGAELRPAGSTTARIQHVRFGRERLAGVLTSMAVISAALAIVMAAMPIESAAMAKGGRNPEQQQHGGSFHHVSTLPALALFRYIAERKYTPLTVR